MKTNIIINKTVNKTHIDKFSFIPELFISNKYSLITVMSRNKELIIGYINKIELNKTSKKFQLLKALLEQNEIPIYHEVWPIIKAQQHKMWTSTLQDEPRKWFFTST